MLRTLDSGNIGLVELKMPAKLRLTDDQLCDFCQLNRELRIEQTHKGHLIIMAPAGGESSSLNAYLTIDLGMWARKNGDGVVFDSSGSFKLPNGATRSPDASWVKRSRLAQLTAKQKKKFIPLAPDFVIELRSPSDNLSDLQNKMTEYVANGVQLGWLINPQKRQVFIYRPDQAVEELNEPSHINGDPILPDFILDLQEIWEPSL